LYEIGNLWQLSAITPAHEHFISNLIKQKIHGAIENLKIENKDSLVPYVLYLPPREIHEIGLLYLHYELLEMGYKSIYLGQSVPLSNLKDLAAIYDEINFVTYLTVEPSDMEVDAYLEDMKHLVLLKPEYKLYVMGAKVKECTNSLSGVHIYKGVEDFLNNYRDNV